MTTWVMTAMLIFSLGSKPVPYTINGLANENFCAQAGVNLVQLTKLLKPGTTGSFTCAQN
jgi:hypothetical protein